MKLKTNLLNSKNMIYSLQELTEKQKVSFYELFRTFVSMNIYEVASPKYNENGLRFSLNHLNTVSLNIIFLPVEFMANYSDIVCFEMVRCNDFEAITAGVEQISELVILPEKEQEAYISNLNATSVGNLALIYTKAKNTEQLKSYVSRIEQILKIIYSYASKALKEKMKTDFITQLEKTDNPIFHSIF